MTLLVKTFFEGPDNNLNVDAYNDPLIALKNFKRGIYKFILLDIKMKPIDGLELYKRIRDLDKKVTIFLFTATFPLFDEYKKICSSFEEKYFIQKPISLSDLLQCIRSAMS